MKMDDQPVLSLNDVKKVLEQRKKQKVKQRFFDSAERFLSRKQLEDHFKHRLENTIPTGKKYRVLRKMSQLFDNKRIIKNYRLTQCFISTIRDYNRRLRKFNAKDYEDRKLAYNERIKNHFKILKKFWKSTNYTIKFGKKHSQVALLKTSRK